MKNYAFINAANEVSLSSPLLMEEIEDLIRGTDFKRLRPNDFQKFFPENHTLAILLIAMWAYDLLADPKFTTGNLMGYNSVILNNSEKNLIAQGLIETLKRCRIEDEDNENAIDYHYRICGNLYRLEGEKTENLLVDSIIQSSYSIPSTRLIIAIGLLVGFQKTLKESTVGSLLEIVRNGCNESEQKRIAREILTEDVLRVNNYSKFLKNLSEILDLLEQP